MHDFEAHVLHQLHLNTASISTATMQELPESDAFLIQIALPDTSSPRVERIISIPHSTTLGLLADIVTTSLGRKWTSHAKGKGIWKFDVQAITPRVERTFEGGRKEDHLVSLSDLWDAESLSNPAITYTAAPTAQFPVSITLLGASLVQPYTSIILISGAGLAPPPTTSPDKWAHMKALARKDTLTPAELDQLHAFQSTDMHGVAYGRILSSTLYSIWTIGRESPAKDLALPRIARLGDRLESIYDPLLAPPYVPPSYDIRETRTWTRQAPEVEELKKEKQGRARMGRRREAVERGVREWERVAVMRELVELGEEWKRG